MAEASADPQELDHAVVVFVVEAFPFAIGATTPNISMSTVGVEEATCTSENFGMICGKKFSDPVGPPPPHRLVCCGSKGFRGVETED